MLKVSKLPSFNRPRHRIFPSAEMDGQEAIKKTIPFHGSLLKRWRMSCKDYGICKYDTKDDMRDDIIHIYIYINSVDISVHDYWFMMSWWLINDNSIVDDWFMTPTICWFSTFGFHDHPLVLLQTLSCLASMAFPGDSKGPQDDSAETKPSKLQLVLA